MGDRAFRTAASPPLKKALDVPPALAKEIKSAGHIKKKKKRKKGRKAGECDWFVLMRRAAASASLAAATAAMPSLR